MFIIIIINLCFLAVSAKYSLKQLRQFYYTMKDTVVIGGSKLRGANNTANLVKLFKDLFGDKTMSTETYPRYTTLTSCI